MGHDPRRQANALRASGRRPARPALTNLTMNTRRRPSGSRLCSTAQRLGLDAAAGYACTLPFVGNLLADLPSGKRQKEAVGYCMCHRDGQKDDRQNR